MSRVFRFDVRAKLFLASVSVIAIAVLASYAYLSSSLDRTLTARVRDDLFIRLDVAAAEAEQLGPDAGIDAWDALADDLGARAHARVTFIGPDGRVLGDSEVPRDRIASIENHRHRPEVEQALSSGTGSSSRRSATIHERLLYVASPMKNGVVVRLALPLVEVEHAKAALDRSLVIAGIVAVALAALMSLVVAQFASRAIGHLTRVADAMARGDFTARAELAGRDELAALGTALDKLAGSLSVTLRQLRTERDRVERILSGMQEGVLLLDTAGVIAFVNPALRQMLLLGADCVGKTPFEAIQNEELKKLVDEASSTSALQAAEIELAGLKPRRLLIRVVPLAGEPAGLLAVFVDVTDIRRLESMRRDFVANASHELRTPVTAVRSAAETLRFAMQNDPESAGHFLDIIERNAERLQHLVEDLLDLSRIESHEFRLTFGEHEVGPLVGRVVDLFRERSEKKRIALSADVPRDLAPVRVDPRAFEQVLTNLVDNALKYSPERAAVVVRARAETRNGKPVIRLSVVDTGPGIEERHLPRLFERFYRVDTGRSRELGGTGLGLSIVKHLCDALGGPINVESTVGKGTTFSFTLAQVTSR
ncbi:MAG TPA: ATP-binding protein [Polyangiaceae bacterium]